MIAWFKKHFGRGSKVDKLVRALPNPQDILRRADAWAAVLHRFGETGLQWEPTDSRLLQVVKDGADALDMVGPMVGAVGADKLQALTRQVRLAAQAINIADDLFDAWWVTNGRPVLEDYLERRRG